jgi:hypothetical protein
VKKTKTTLEAGHQVDPADSEETLREVVADSEAIHPDGPADSEETLLAAIVADSEKVLNREKCIKQFVLNARKNAKCLSNQQKANQYIAKTAT